MIRTSILILLISVNFFAVSGQEQKLVLTKAQNDQWLNDLKKLPLSSQLSTIKERVLSDTAVFVKKYYNDGIKVVDSLGNRVYGEGKPTMVITGYMMIISNDTEKNKIIELSKLLNTNYIKKMVVLSPDDPALTAIYGSFAQYGVILMTVTKSKYAKLFQKLNLN